MVTTSGMDIRVSYASTNSFRDAIEVSVNLWQADKTTLNSVELVRWKDSNHTNNTHTSDRKNKNAMAIGGRKIAGYEIDRKREQQ